MRTSIPIALAACIQSLIAAPLPGGAELLADNTVIAVYRGTLERPCLARTSDCPDRCGHAKTLAHFDVLKNLHYQKLGEYGDDEAVAGSHLLIGLDSDLPGQDSAPLEAIATMKPGDTVQMTISHYYIKEATIQYPVRPVTSLRILPERRVVSPLRPEDDPIFGVMPLR